LEFLIRDDVKTMNFNQLLNLLHVEAIIVTNFQSPAPSSHVMSTCAFPFLTASGFIMANVHSGTPVILQEI
jgi:hypothetical protein